MEQGVFLGKYPYVAVEGDLPQVVVLNGGQAFVRPVTKQQLIKDAKRLHRLLSGRAFLMIGYDQNPEEGHSLGKVISDLAQILRDRQRPLALIGLSYGGIVATHVLAKHPELVDNLILLASAHRFSTEGDRRIRRQIELLEHGNRHEFLLSFAGLFRRGWMNAMLRMRLMLENLKGHDKLNSPHRIIRHLEAAREAKIDLCQNRRIAARCLVIGGELDPFFDSTCIEELRGFLPQIQTSIFKNEGHMLPVERAHDISRALESFLAVNLFPRKENV
ncbi:alpha/beta hydrolase [Crenobacter sp. SG2303]|uniref:Alpha/beta hydrolase n=1 Tax=Crenobacter oryzisoli TaxID=3056844 RepID=A0ABT7XK95_9NEIS|nr:alpha/beta hydrolase [Crenobacter sp. SG2303]MDN0074204.1 alpha/beta hydrolase [Crenobacter sp. SG2303]